MVLYRVKKRFGILFVVLKRKVDMFLKGQRNGIRQPLLNSYGFSLPKLNPYELHTSSCIFLKAKASGVLGASMTALGGGVEETFKAKGQFRPL